MNWIDEFNIIVVEKYNEERWEIVNKHLISFRWKIAMADYHSKESLSIFSSLIPVDTENAVIETVRMILIDASGADEAQKIRKSHFKSEAHIIAYAQSLHSSFDILAKAIYLGLDLDIHLENKIVIRNQNLFNISDETNKTQFAPNVTTTIGKFLESEEFKYLHAYVNQTKHHSLIGSKQSVSFEDNKHGIRLSAFNKMGGEEKWPRKWAEEFVIIDFKEIKTKLNKIGSELVRYIDTI